MIELFYEDGSSDTVTGKAGNSLSYKNEFFNGLDVKVQDGKLIITKNDFFGDSLRLDYDMDGWIGRYGMPVEFLVALHLSTMSPDLAYTVATSFDTTVQVLLHKIESAEVDAQITIGNSTITKDAMAQYLGENWVDEAILTDNEIYKLYQADVIDAYKGGDEKIPEDKYKCTGPPNWHDINKFEGQHSSSNLRNLATDSEKEGNWEKAALMRELRKSIEKFEEDKKIKIKISDENKNTLIKQIEEYFWISDNSTSSLDTKLASTNTRMSSKVVSRSQEEDSKKDYSITITLNRGNFPREFVIQIDGPDGTTDELPIAPRNAEQVFSEVRDVKKFIADAIWSKKDELKLADETKEIIKKGLENLPVMPDNSYDNIDSAAQWASNIQQIKISGIKFKSANSNENNNNENKDTDQIESDIRGDITPDKRNDYDYIISTREGEQGVFFYTEGISDEGLIEGVRIEISNYKENGERIWVYSFATKTSSDSNGDHLECDDEGYDGKNGICQNCKNYVNAIFQALKDVDVEEKTTYSPYLGRVTDHWFRDVYFTADAIGSNEIIATDTEYEKATGERWTLYETDDEGNYKLYVYEYNASDNSYNTTFSNILCKKVEKGKGDYELQDDGTTYVYAKGKPSAEYILVNTDGKTKYSGSLTKFRVGKKAQLEMSDEVIEKLKNSYELGNESREWRDLEVKDDTPDSVKDVYSMGYTMKYSLISKKINQIEDGVRGVTNPKIKEIFLDNYYIFDGSTLTADLINFFKNFAKNNEGRSERSFNDPDWYLDYKGLDYGLKPQSYYYEGRSMFSAIDEYYETHQASGNEPWTVKPSDVSGSISLNHDSLNAFSILTNMHTLDAEYIYHDFKELVVELNYFDKEDLVDAEEEVMMFPVAGLSAKGWPVARYDRSEEFYGTLIHSKEDLQAKEGEKLAELVRLFGLPEVEDSMETEYGEASGGGSISPGTTAEAGDYSALDSSSTFVCIAASVMQKMQQAGFTYQNSPRAENINNYSVAKTDCSGYVTMVLKEAGIIDESVAYKSAEFAKALLNKNGVEVNENGISSYDEVKPGTIIIFEGHSSIYAGGGLFLDAGSDGRIKKSPVDITTKADRTASYVKATIYISNEACSGSASSYNSNSISGGTSSTTSGKITTTSQFLATAEKVGNDIKGSTYTVNSTNHEPISNIYSICCSSYVLKVLYEAGLIEDATASIHDKRASNGGFQNYLSETLKFQEVSKEECRSGDIVAAVEGGSKYSSAGHAFIVKEINGDEMSTYEIHNKGTINDVNFRQNFNDMNLDKVRIFRTPLTYDGPNTSGTTADSNANNSNQEEEEKVKFEGYRGSSEEKDENDQASTNNTEENSNENSSTKPEEEEETGPEYVVAPVTGEVLKYGTIVRNNIETGEKNEVGFIKIKVLDNSKKLASKIDEFVENKISTAVYDEEAKPSDWLKDNYPDETQRGLLGYDCFWEEYRDAGITGNVVYLEGFDVSQILGTNSAKSSKDTIKKLYDSILDEENTNNSYATAYSVPNLLDNNREYQMKIAELAKQEAVYATQKGEKIYIKEGAVIGQTFSSDDEKITEKVNLDVIELDENGNLPSSTQSTEENSQQQEENNTESEDSKNNDKDNKKDKKDDKDKKAEEEEAPKDGEEFIENKEYHIGNYMRIIMRDDDDEVVEDVEDYIEKGDAQSNLNINIPEWMMHDLVQDPNYKYTGARIKWTDTEAFVKNYDFNDPDLYLSKEEIEIVFADYPWIVEHAEEFEAAQKVYNVSALVMGISAQCESQCGQDPGAAAKHNSYFGTGMLKWNGSDYEYDIGFNGQVAINGSNSYFDDPVMSLYMYGLWYNVHYLKRKNPPKVNIDACMTGYCENYAKYGVRPEGYSVYPYGKIYNKIVANLVAIRN